MRERSRIHVLSTAIVLIGSLALLGCPKRPEVAQAPPTPVGPGAAVAPAPAPAGPQTAETPVTRPPAPSEAPVQPAPSAPAPAPAAPPAAAASPTKDVFFNFDKSDIGFNEAFKEDQKPSMNANVAWLKANARAKLTIEGHCDERGTVEYNLGLGERRAKAGKDYLVAAGIPADRIAVISYGKERPFVLGHDEGAWKWNRRDHMVITGQ
ncbi:MAG TPA: OmpA family protein [Candidatus Acidoferrum sp.]|nr:OmpA family protein [Candidatus Acidoferrum sp.]